MQIGWLGLIIMFVVLTQNVKSCCIEVLQFHVSSVISSTIQHLERKKKIQSCVKQRVLSYESQV